MKREKKAERLNTPKRYHFRLFVAGDEPNSRQAQETLKRLCASHLQGQYKIEIIDVLKDYKAALAHNVLFAPTLIILSPPPETRIIGSLRDVKKVLGALGLPAAEEAL